MNADGWLVLVAGLCGGIGMCTVSVVAVSVWMYVRSKRSPE